MFTPKLRIWWRLISVFCLLLTAWLWVARYNSLKIHPSLQESTRLTIKCTLREEPVFKDTYQYFHFRNIVVIGPSSPRYHYGDQLMISGVLKPGATLLTQTEITLLAESRGGWLWLLANKWRQSLSHKINILLPEPQASLLKGILLGVKSDLSPDFYDALKRTGTLHVIVASGYNISFISGLIIPLLRFLGRRLSLVTALGLLYFYSLLAGGDPPIMRALLMGSLVCIGDYLGRPSAALRLLLVSALIMLMLDPLLVGDLSFQLSFLATLSLISVAPILKRLAPNIRLGDFWDSLASQLLVWPLIAFNFQTVSVWSPLTNLLVLWAVGPAMIAGLLILIVPVSLTVLSTLSAMFAAIPLTYFVRAVSTLSRLPLSLVSASINLWGLLAYYMVLLLFLAWSYSRGFIQDEPR